MACIFNGAPVPAENSGVCNTLGGTWIPDDITDTDFAGRPLDTDFAGRTIYDIEDLKKAQLAQSAPAQIDRTQTRVERPGLYDKTVGGFLHDAQNFARAQRGEAPLPATQDPRQDRVVTTPYQDPLGGANVASDPALRAAGIADRAAQEQVPVVPQEPQPAPTLFDRMGTREYWYGPEGTDPSQSRLSRIGQLMEHFGTPLKQRGEHPAKAWASQTKAGLAAQRSVSDAQQKRWADMIPNETTLIKQFLKDKKGVIADSKPGTEEHAKAAASATAYKYIANQLITEGIEPSPKNVKARLDQLKKQKK